MPACHRYIRSDGKADEEAQYQKANIKTTKKKPCHNRHTNQAHQSHLTSPGLCTRVQLFTLCGVLGLRKEILLEACRQCARYSRSCEQTLRKLLLQGGFECVVSYADVVYSWSFSGPRHGVPRFILAPKRREETKDVVIASKMRPNVGCLQVI